MSVYAAMLARVAISGISLSAARILACEGDSRNSGATSPPMVYGASANPKVIGINKSVTGSTLASVVARSAEMTMIPGDKSAGHKFFAFIGPMGANDLATYAGATDTIAATAYATAMAAYVDSLYAAGFDIVVLATELPQDNTTTPDATRAKHNVRRGILNSLYTSSWSSLSSNSIVIADYAADPVMGPDDSYNVNPTYWADVTHPSTLGYSRLESAVLRAVLDALS